jgi:hypothetical protein
MKWPKCEKCGKELVLSGKGSYCPYCEPEKIKPEEKAPPALGVSVSENVGTDDRMR